MSASTKHFPETILPNGRRVYYLREAEATVLYEVVPSYLKHGIALCPGDTVFDVGSNIGMVSLWLNWQFTGSLNIFAFEPVPEIFAVLKLNAMRYNPQKIKVFPFGLSNEAKAVPFGYYPRLPSMSSAYPDGSKKERDKLKRTILRNLNDAPSTCQKLKWVPPFLRSPLLDFEFKKGLQAEKVTCQMKTLSQIIQDQRITQVDWLKIDVEKSELDVLQGIQLQDWPKIRQVSLEVHDLDNRLKKVTKLLEMQGLDKIVVGQEPLFKGSDVFYVHALRSN